ncbi:MAG: PilZ domain-containing protein [bacterium]|nr:MAG: PilZ domain-containing protein [bacterium]
MRTGNHRRHPRIYLPVEVNYHVGEDLYRETTLSLSMGGLYVKTDRPLEVGSIFHVDFKLPDYEHLFKAWGMVIWKKMVEDVHGPPGMGVKFYDVSVEDKRALLHYLAGSQKTRGGY